MAKDASGVTVAQARPLVIAHSSDIHVDDHFAARQHGGDALYPLRQVIVAAQGVGADLLLLAGDVFEHNRLPQTVVDETARLLDKAELAVVMLPGNHDPLTPDTPYRRGVAEPSNVHVLGVSVEQAILFEEWELEIWGHAHQDYSNMLPLRSPHPRTTRWQIATAHGHYEADPAAADGRLLPSWLISEADLLATGADYVALGHWNRHVRVGNGAVPAYYSGSPDLARTINVVRLSPYGTITVDREPVPWD
jgi:DNA repair exonuclease SbcCD nuclease subunit